MTALTPEQRAFHKHERIEHEHTGYRLHVHEIATAEPGEDGPRAGVTFTATMDAWLDDRRLAFRPGEDCREYPAIGESVAIHRNVGPLRAPVVDAGLDVERLVRLVVSYADLTHEVIVSGRGVSRIADEWGQVVEACRRYLALREAR